MSPTAILVPADLRRPCVHARAFRGAGVKVAEASSGADVKRFLSIQSPDVILLEAGINRAASADVWRVLDQSTSAAHVVMFGDFRDDAVRADAREHGALCLAPQSEEDLVAAVQELIRRYHEAREEMAHLRAALNTSMREFRENLKRCLSLQEQLPAGEGVVVLVAEDEECVRRFFRLTLERSGYLVLEAADGNQAVRALWNFAGIVRLVILDWAMPGLSGLEIVRSMRKVSPEARLLICTGSPESIIRPALHGEIVEGILEKPFLALDLLAEVQNQMRLARDMNIPVAGRASHRHG